MNTPNEAGGGGPVQRQYRYSRFERMQYALSRMATSVLGSGITTMGSSMFLFFCTMAVFNKYAHLRGIIQPCIKSVKWTTMRNWKYESKHDRETIFYCFVFAELSTD